MTPPDLEWAEGLSSRAQNILLNLGVRRVDDLSQVSPKTLLGRRNCGRSTVVEIVKFAKSWGVTMEDPAPRYRRVMRIGKRVRVTIEVL